MYLNEYSYNAYPPYNYGGAVLLTRQTVKEFYYAIQHVKLFKFDDVYAGNFYFLKIKKKLF